MRNEPIKIPGALQKYCCEELLQLLPQKAIFWPAKSTLLVADVHAGKAEVFNRASIAVPAGISEATIRDLFDLITVTKAERVIVLGDFVHGQQHADELWIRQFEQYLDLHKQLDFRVVIGNHDKLDTQNVINIPWIPGSMVDAPFIFTHEPRADSRGYVLSGHLHPAWRLQSSRKESLRAPVFWFRSDVAVLPAFGNFTGAKVVKPEKSDQLYITGPDSVINVSSNVFSIDSRVTSSTNTE